LKFYESDIQNPKNINPQYLEIFPFEDTDFINVVFNLEYSNPKKDMVMSFRVAFHRPNGELLEEIDIPLEIRKGQENIEETFSTNTLMHNWDTGEYTVQVYLEENFIISGNFVVLAPQPTATPTPTNTPTPTPTSTPTPTPTLDFRTSINTGSVGLYGGPGTGYGIELYVDSTESLMIRGAVYDCEWIEVILMDGETTGWISSKYLEYEVDCSNIPQSEIPSTPTPVVGKSSYVPPPNSIPLYIINNTDRTLTLELNGPIHWTFYFPIGENVIFLPSGAYSYSGYSCGSYITGYYNINYGSIWGFWCE